MARIRGAAIDSAVPGSFLIAGGDKQYYVYSNRREQLVAFARTGKERWSTAPGSLGRVRDLQRAPSGELLVLNAATPALVRIGADGRTLGTTRIAAQGMAERVIALKNKKYVVLSVNAPEPLLLTDSTGRVLRRFGVPWSGYSDLHPMARQAMLASDNASDVWSFLFVFGDGWFAFRDSVAERMTGRFVEHTEFPEVVIDSSRSRRSVRFGKVKSSAQGAFIRNGMLNVLFYGAGDARGKVIDRYRLSDGGYVDSYLLPVDPNAMTVDEDGNIVLLLSESRPEILVLHPRGARKP